MIVSHVIYVSVVSAVTGSHDNASSRRAEQQRSPRWSQGRKRSYRCRQETRKQRNRQAIKPAKSANPATKTKTVERETRKPVEWKRARVIHESRTTAVVRIHTEQLRAIAPLRFLLQFLLLAHVPRLLERALLHRSRVTPPLFHRRQAQLFARSVAAMSTVFN